MYCDSQDKSVPFQWHSHSPHSPHSLGRALRSAKPARMDAALYKDFKVSRGLTYHYFYSPAAAGYPTLLFVHGFPASSFDWHRQVEYFRPKGYGILAADNLGAGGTSKPEDPEVFRFALIARDFVDLLDAEGLNKVVGIGHDW